jgi:hypothetical protein
MELFRVTQDAWGQEILQGVSWDLLPIFFGAGVVFIVVHVLYMALWAPRTKGRARPAERAIAGE